MLIASSGIALISIRVSVAFRTPNLLVFGEVMEKYCRGLMLEPEVPSDRTIKAFVECQRIYAKTADVLRPDFGVEHTPSEPFDGEAFIQHYEAEKEHWQASIPDDIRSQGMFVVDVLTNC